VENKELLTGTVADIMIEGAYAHSLWGHRVPIDGRHTEKRRDDHCCTR
jgi:hypothetical protein